MSLFTHNFDSAVKRVLGFRVESFHSQLRKRRATPGGKTALHTAAYNNRPDICKLLLMHGADPNAEDEHGFVPVRALKA